MEDWDRITIEFERIGLPGHGWKVSYKKHGMYETLNESGPNTLFETGGGSTLHDALTNAVRDRMVKRLAR